MTSGTELNSPSSVVAPSAARAWLNTVVVAAGAAFVLAAAGLGKARDKGGSGFQLTMTVLSALVLVGVLVARRRAISGKPVSAVGSLPRMAEINPIPRPSLRALPAQS